VGVISLEAALEMAQERELDLVEVAPENTPPVCRLQDFDKLRYERKRQREKSRKQSKRQELKELRLSPNTSDNDVNTKLKKARKFLESGDKVKFMVRFMGREISHPELGREILARLVEGTADIAEVELAPKFEGKTLSVIIRPVEESAE